MPSLSEASLKSLNYFIRNLFTGPQEVSEKSETFLVSARLFLSVSYNKCRHIRQILFFQSIADWVGHKALGLFAFRTDLLYWNDMFIAADVFQYNGLFIGGDKESIK